MLTRVFIDNFRSFVDFQFEPGSRQLILGGNGSGKSSFVDALLLLRRFTVECEKNTGETIASQRTRWLSKDRQTFEIDSNLEAKRAAGRIGQQDSSTTTRRRER